MGTYVVTGDASGIGAATAALLTERGHQVIGVDRAGADVEQDLSTADVDGGTDALMKPTWPRSAYVPKPVMDLATRAVPIATGIRKRLSR